MDRILCWLLFVDAPYIHPSLLFPPRTTVIPTRTTVIPAQAGIQNGKAKEPHTARRVFGFPLTRE